MQQAVVPLEAVVALLKPRGAAVVLAPDRSDPPPLLPSPPP